VAKPRIGGQRNEQRQVVAQAVEGPDCSLGIGHADVNVQAADRSDRGIAEQIADPIGGIPWDVKAARGAG
jgi:hypothetical protein